MLLCFIAGPPQRRPDRKLSRAEIRTAHITGIVTISASSWTAAVLEPPRRTSSAGSRSTTSVWVLSLPLALYFLYGPGLPGPGFNRLGCMSTLPLAFAADRPDLVPMLDDLRSGWRRF